ncbi:MAG: DUF5060 domain-containing protein, partial [Planctomycetes bacterium]|nr:DUF5060 domain-containing protein [Planctomycetota bacterium]
MTRSWSLTVASALLAVAALFTAAAAGEVTTFTLINADSNQPIPGYAPMAAGATLNLATLPTRNLNIRADVDTAPGSVRFGYDGNTNYKTETAPPYALAGDSSGDYFAWTPTVGGHTVTGTAWSGAGATGTPGRTVSLAFTVVDGGTPPPGGNGDGNVAISGELKQWHKVTLTLAGPSASESSTPNPFTDFRFDVTFSNGPLSYVVPGYFAADGNAGESSATSGTSWRAHLSPDLTGTWTWTIGFRQGANVAQNGGGSTLAPYHGRTGSFTIGATDKGGRDFRAKGRLEYVGQRYLRHKGNGEWFIKAGSDSPENFLNNTEIDGTVAQPGATDRRHNWSAHLGDWQSGDPVWKGDKGKGVIGAVNYLASTGCNVFSFLTMNINGDSRDVWPYAAYDNRLRMDCSKLDQWEAIFAHADRKGMYLHFKTQETENDQLLDGGNVGNERRLYYRELIARFGHHLALNWNLGEENVQSDAQRKAMAQYFRDTDPYDHHIVLHTYPGAQEGVYRPMLGSASALSGASIQIDWNAVHDETRQWIEESVAAGRPWVVANDEQGNAGDGIPPQPGWPGYNGGGPNRPSVRHQVLWGNLMAGGAGVEAYFGYSHPHSDLTCRDWRSRADWWAMCNHALNFFRANLPYQLMNSQDGLVGNGASSGNGRYCFAQVGQVYAIYVPTGMNGTADLDLSGQSGSFTVQWFNPRSGGSLQNGATVSGGGVRNLGAPPADAGQDWVILVKRGGSTQINQAPSVSAGPDRAITAGASASLDGTVSDDGLPSGALNATWTSTSGPGSVAFANANAVDTTATFSANGTYVLRLTTSDGALSASDEMTVTVSAQPTGGVIAINSGGGAYTAPDGTVYIADQYVTGGSVFALASGEITGTTADEVYRSERFGTFTYAIPVANGSYNLRLQFAEIYFTANGQRVFDVLVEGQERVANLDIYAQVGARAAYDVVLAVTVGDGSLTITSRSDIDNAKLSAIVVTPAQGSNAAPTVSAGPDRAITLPTASAALDGTVNDDGLPSGALTTTWSQVSGPSTATFANANAVDTTVNVGAAGTYVLRLTASDGALSASDDVLVTVSSQPTGGIIAINAGGGAYTAPDGTAYVADQYVTGGSTYAIATGEITGTTADEVYRSERFGAFTYAIPVANGSYSLRLQFAEIYYTANGQRVFDVLVEGQEVVANLDIHAQVGALAAYEVTVPVTVNDGSLTITSRSDIDNAKLSAIVVVPANQPQPTGPTVTGFTLINTVTDQPVPGYDPMPANATIDTSAIGT